MNRSTIEALLAFSEYAWGEYTRMLRPLGDAVLVQPAPGSGWPALRDVLVHITWASVRWLWDPTGTTDLPVEAVQTWDQLEDYHRRVLAHVRARLDSLDDTEMNVPRVMNVDGEPLRYSPAEIFVHALLHERQHHGDLNTLLYQLGLEPPIVEYRFSLPHRTA